MSSLFGKTKLVMFWVIFLFIFIALECTTFAQAPGGLTCKVKKDGVMLNWQPSPGAVRGYYVKRSDDGGSFKKIGFAGDDTSYFDSEAQKGKNYSYVVVAADSKNNEAGSSNIVNVNMSGAADKSEDDGKRKIGSARPKVYTEPKAGKPKHKDEETEIEKTADEEQPEYRPEPEPQPKPKKARKALETPDIPRNINISSDRNFIKLSWSAARGATGYFVYRSLSGRNDDFLLIKKINSGTSFEDRLVKSGKTYYYFVAAFAKNDMDDSVKSERSEIVSASLD